MSSTYSPESRTIGERLNRLLGFLSEEIEDDEKPIAPEAFRALLAMMEPCRDLIERHGPLLMPHLGTLGGGEIVAEWLGDGRDILMFVEVAGNSRLYEINRKGTDKPGIVNPSPGQLAASMRWYLGADHLRGDDVQGNAAGEVAQGHQEEVDDMEH